jgi:hypothetical protein
MSSIWNNIAKVGLRVVPTVVGAYFGGPKGAMAGYQLGSTASNAFIKDEEKEKTVKSMADHDSLAAYKTGVLADRESSSIMKYNDPSVFDKALPFIDMGFGIAGSLGAFDKVGAKMKAKGDMFKKNLFGNKSERINNTFENSFENDINSGLWDDTEFPVNDISKKTLQYSPMMPKGIFTNEQKFGPYKTGYGTNLDNGLLNLAKMYNRNDNSMQFSKYVPKTYRDNKSRTLNQY